VPGEESERFRRNIDVVVDFAQSTGCAALNALYGNRVSGVTPEEQDELALENLASAARAADGIGAVLLIEALNAIESPHCPIVSAPKAVAVADSVNEATGLGNAKFLMDLYHLAMNGEDLHKVIDEFTARTGHVQIADSPGRGAPGTGELDFPDLLGRLAKAGYEGRVGLEYKPGDQPSAESFEWLPRPLRGRA
jgi:hydroxypyruvate isomerase